MTDKISAEVLDSLLNGTSQFALIDVRDPGEYNSSHIPGSSLVPRRQLEFLMPQLVPYKDVPVVLCDDDGQKSMLAAMTLERMRYPRASVLDGGMNRWSTLGYPTEWGTNVPSKEFGEKVEVVYQVPEMGATELHDRMERGEKLVILDTRTPEEYRRFCIPGGRSVPGGELALRIRDIIADLDEETTVVVNCAGRTRSIIGTRMLQRLGVTNVYGLKNGTSGWALAGYELESGADRLDLSEPSEATLTAAEAYAVRLAAEDGVRYLDIDELLEMMARRDHDTIYLVDVRTREEYEEAHIPGFRWVPGGQAVQRSDDVSVVKNSTIVFACDRKARATFTASWFRQMGFSDVYAVDGGVTSWKERDLPIDAGLPESMPHGLNEAIDKVSLVSPEDMQQAPTPVTIFVDTSDDFARGHIPGSHWVPRGWLEFRIVDVVPPEDAPITVTCSDGVQSVLAGATLSELGYRGISVLEGGMASWQAAGLPVEKGLSGVMTPPNDVVLSGPDRNYADAINYLRWEVDLGSKYETH